MINQPPIQLQAGDVLLFRRKQSVSAIPRLIAWIQGNEHVHVAVVVQADPRPLVAEADTGYGTRITLYELSALLERPCIARSGVLVNKEKLMDAAYQSNNKKYAYEKIFDACINHLLGRVLGFFNRSYKYRTWFAKNRKNNRFICSTLVSYLLSQASHLEYNPCAEPDDFTTGQWQVLVHEDNND